MWLVHLSEIMLFKVSSGLYNSAMLASFPGRSCLQFLIACSMQKQRGKAWERVTCTTSGRQWGSYEGGVPGKESWGPSCNILSKNLRLQHSKDNINTACCPVDSRLINTRFVSYNNRAPPRIYPHVYLMSCTWLFLLGLPAPFLHTASVKKLEMETAWEWG